MRLRVPTFRWPFVRRSRPHALAATLAEEKRANAEHVARLGAAFQADAKALEDEFTKQVTEGHAHWRAKLVDAIRDERARCARAARSAAPASSRPSYMRDAIAREIEHPSSATITSAPAPHSSTARSGGPA